MVAFNFTVFIDKVESGEKRRTIRRKRRCEPGAKLQLYTGMMHKGCRKLRDAICTAVTPIKIGNDGISVLFHSPRRGAHNIVRDVITGYQADEFARLDGFRDYEHMAGWFRETYPDAEFPLICHLHEWNPLPKDEEAPVKKRHPRPRRYPKKRKL